MSDLTIKSVALASTMSLLLLVTYLFSYAPVVRYEVEAHRGQFFEPTNGLDGDWWPVYKPIDWLIDNTSLKKPLFAWARLWKVGADFRWAASKRAYDRLHSRWPPTQNAPLLTF